MTTLLIVLPLLLFLGVALDRALLPGRLTRQNGGRIAQALRQYQRDNGFVPETLDALVPGYFSELPKLIEWDSKWLYVTTASEFHFGYVANVDKFGY